VEAIRRAGVGNLYEAFLQLKEKLTAEGLFDPARKRAIPTFARTIGIVTSPQAAALRDIVTTLKRRAPHVQLVLYPTPVQGEGAAGKIAQAIATASARGECDLLLVCRGGGSIEDLWSFNHELVARTIVGCDIPVIVGVGHETDFTIADFAADLRAPTPTAAAEMAAMAQGDWLSTLANNARDLQRIVYRQLNQRMQMLDWLARRLVSPLAYIAHERTKLQAMHAQLKHATRIPLAQAGFALTQARNRLQANLPDTRAQQLQLDHTQRRLHGLMHVRLHSQ
jgi:exodeoxyribonuclease VII large subunit